MRAGLATWTGYPLGPVAPTTNDTPGSRTTPATTRRSRALPLVEALERRDAPSASPWLTESFDTTPAGSIPAGWARSGSASFAVSAARALSPANGLATSATSATATARTWLQAALPADVQVSAALYLDSPVPGQVFARGSGLDTAAPNYYAVAITRGMQVRLLRVLGGSATVLTQTASVDGVRNEWVRATLSAVGTTLRVQVYRVATGQYLTSTGGWHAAPTWALTATDGSLTGPGRAGVARGAGQPGTLTFDDVAIDLPNAADSFDQDAAGRLPAAWAGWTSAGAAAAAFRVTPDRALSGAQALSSTASLSSAAARAWVTTPQPADVEPLPYSNNTAGTLGQATATTHALPGTYYTLNADGTVGPAVTSVTLRNGEGVILLKQKPA
jgi:hypothetical protein